MVYLVVFKVIAVVNNFDHVTWILNLHGMMWVLLNERGLMNGVANSRVVNHDFFRDTLISLFMSTSLMKSLMNRMINKSLSNKSLSGALGISLRTSRVLKDISKIVIVSFLSFEHLLHLESVYLFGHLSLPELLFLLSSLQLGSLLTLFLLSSKLFSVLLFKYLCLNSFSFSLCELLPSKKLLLLSPFLHFELLSLPFCFSFFISFLLCEHDQPLIFESSLFSLLPLSL